VILGTPAPFPFSHFGHYERQTSITYDCPVTVQFDLVSQSAPCRNFSIRSSDIGSMNLAFVFAI